MSDGSGSDGGAPVVGEGTVLSLHYTVRDEAADRALETSAGGEPMTILFGQGGLLRPVQDALRGKAAGDQVSVTVPPEEAFGERRTDAVQRLSKKYFHDARRLRAGDRARVQTEEGPRPVTVVKVGGKVVDVDTNHPYAGLTLTFVMEVLSVREASPEEKAHGHAHGPGGHQH